MNKYIIGQMNNRNKSLKYDFRPSMQEIIERPANKCATVIIFLISTLIVATVIWAYFFELDIIVTASGVVADENGPVTITAGTSGIVSEVYVSDGDHVSAGDCLIQLDTQRESITIAGYREDIELLEVQRNLYTKIYERLTEYVGDTDTDAFDIGSVDDKYAHIKEALELEYLTYMSDVSNLKSADDRTKAISSYRLTTIQNINSIDVKTENLYRELDTATLLSEEKQICAKTDGYVSGLADIREGDVITTNDNIGYICPEISETTLRAYISDEDIGSIVEDMSVNVRIAAYDDTEYDHIGGRVVSIGVIPVNIENRGTVYPVTIAPDNLPESIKLGMEGRCDIVVGRRTVLDYFLEPFIKSMQSSLKEK